MIDPRGQMTPPHNDNSPTRSGDEHANAEDRMNRAPDSPERTPHGAGAPPLADVGPLTTAPRRPNDLRPETWRPVPGWAAYEVSNLHRVRSYWIRGRRLRLSAAVQRILKPFDDPETGERSVILRDGHGSRVVASIARLVAEAWRAQPTPPEPEDVRSDEDFETDDDFDARWSRFVQELARRRAEFWPSSFPGPR